MWGGPGRNTLVEEADVDFTLNDRELRGLGIDQVRGFQMAILTGGIGNNRIDARTFGGRVSLMGGEGDDLLIGTDSDDWMDGGQGNDRLDGGIGDDWLSGRGGRDTMLGGNGRDRLFGGADNDIAMGGNGDDVIYGQGGRHDTVAGGDGMDLITADASEVDENFAYWSDWVDAV